MEMMNSHSDPRNFPPIRYRYDETIATAVQPDQYLRLTTGGRMDVSTPFAESIRPDDSLLILYSLRGSGQLAFGRTLLTIGNGTILLFPCSAPCQLCSTLLPWSFRVFLAAGPELRKYLPLLGEVFITTRQKNPSMASAVEELASYSETVHLSSLISIHRLLTDILAQACLLGLPEDPAPSDAKLPSYLRDFHAYIHDCRNLAFSLADLEALYGISRYRLCREYSAAFHISPLKDFNQIRMKEAKRLLSDTQLQVQEISGRLGYGDINHFIRLFKAETGLTPGAFRAQVRHREPDLLP